MDERALRELELDSVARLCAIIPSAEAPLAPGHAARQAPPAADALGVAAMQWDALREAVRTCTACGLCRQRKQAVFGVGHESAPWLFIGEGPGADEDEQGHPFVGQAGKLPVSMVAAIGLARGRAGYIATVVTSRPPGNRRPSPYEPAP